MEAVKYFQFEAALPSHKSALQGCSDGRGLGLDGQLPPERAEVHGLDPACSGVPHTAASTASTARPSQEEMREKILTLEAVMLGMKEHQVELKVTHHFSPGIYMRELFIPKGTTLTGKIHKTEHLNILSQGKLTVMTEDGMKTLTASTVIKSSPGMKRAGYAHEDSIWITVHHNPSDEQDVHKVEDMLVVDTFEELLEFQKQQKQIEGGK